MRRSFAAAVMVLGLLGGAAACGGGDDSSSSATTAGPSETTAATEESGGTAEPGGTAESGSTEDSGGTEESGSTEFSGATAVERFCDYAEKVMAAVAARDSSAASALASAGQKALRDATAELATDQSQAKKFEECVKRAAGIGVAAAGAAGANGG